MREISRDERIGIYQKLIDASHATARAMGTELKIKASENIMKAIKGEPFDKELAILEFEVLETRTAMATVQRKFIELRLPDITPPKNAVKPVVFQ